MYNTTAEYKKYIKKPSREFECRVTIGNNVYTNKGIVKMIFDTIQPVDGFSIGNTVSQSMELTLFNDKVTYPSIGKVIVEIGLKIGNSIEYIPMGVYFIDDVEKNDFIVKLTCYDNMIKFERPYFSSLKGNPTLQQVINELSEITGVEFTGTVPDYTVKVLKGYTCREVLGYIASACGGNAFITRNGKFTISFPKEIDYSITGDNYITYKIEEVYKIGKITCKNKDSSQVESDYDDYDSANDKTTISVGTLSADTMELTFENPLVNENILNYIYNKLKNFSYLGYTLKWQGDLSLDISDIITVTDVKGVSRKACVFANKLTYTGGLIQETEAKGETKNSNTFSNDGPSTKNIERLAVKLLIAEQAIINKANIKDLKATNARIENLDAAIANIDSAFINYAKVEQLNAIKANIADLVAKDAQIANALINKAEITQLNAANANISKLDATVADIKTLVNGNLTSANIHSLVLTSDKITVENGFIKNAMIDNLVADKITSGTINTNNVQITSANGGMLINGPTQQFKDGNNEVRLQIGQDAVGNFNFILVGEDGKSVLLDTTGIHENAIADGLIKTDMLSNAAVTADKINYESVIKGLNDESNTNYIKSSKVNIDLLGQTLDIAFNSLKTTVDNLKTSTDITTINVMQGKIETLISNTTIEKDGQITQLKDAYSSTVETVDNLKTTLGEHKSKINEQTGQIESVTSRTATIETTLTGLQASFSYTKEELNTTKNQLASLKTTLDGFSTNIENRIENIKVGARNYILASAFNEFYLEHWDLNPYNNLEAYLYNDYVYNALVCNNITDDWQESGQSLNIMESEIEYTFSAMVFGECIISVVEVIYDKNNNRNNYVIAELEVSTNKYTKVKKTFKTSDNIRYGYLTFSTPRMKISKIALPKLEKGTLDTDWIVAPEDTNKDMDNINSNIAIIENTIIETINTTKSEIKQTTDSISNNVSSLQSKTTTIESTLNNKADISKVTEINSTVSSLTTNLSGITARTETLESKTSNLESSVKSNVTEISALKGEIALKVEQTDITSAINTLDGKVQESINSLSGKIEITAGQIKNTVSKNDIGTIITQSSTEVMTAFNGISKYFEVSSDGAKFGDINNGAYTKMSANGLEHVDSFGATPYFYITDIQAFYIEQSSGDTGHVEVFVPFFNDMKRKLNGKIPSVFVVDKIFYSKGDITDGSCYVKDINADGFTISASVRGTKIGFEVTVYDDQYTSSKHKVNVYNKTNRIYGGSITGKVVILA
ncbi:UNVERIFIED_ORG: hypothetical protein B2H93_14425 [Clostridium botulinum]